MGTILSQNEIFISGMLLRNVPLKYGDIVADIHLVFEPNFLARIDSIGRCWSDRFWKKALGKKQFKIMIPSFLQLLCIAG